MTDTIKGTGTAPNADDWFEGCGRRLEVQTEKQAWKVIPCTNAGCDTDLVVNTFYAPAKGKCSRHGEHKASAIASSHLVHSADQSTAVANGALAKVDCPLCGSPLIVQRIDEERGTIVFRCTDGSEITNADVNSGERRATCGTSVVIKPGLAWTEYRSIPNKMQDIVEDFNVGQRVEYYDRLEAKNAKPTTAG